MSSAQAGTGSAWSPLSIPLFRTLWLVTIASNIGTWMHDIGAGWLMLSLSPEPVMVALVQTATSLPIFFLALPAGALADIVDRRKYLLAIQVWLAAVATALGILTLSGMMTPWLLVTLTLAMGAGAAMMMPAWAALTPEVVPRSELQNAIALNSMGMNVARAIGPAIAGLILSVTGPGLVFVLNAVSFLGVIAVLIAWRRQATVTTLPAERFFSALRNGVRFTWHHAPLHAAVVRGMAFFLFASASWALLPLIAKNLVGGGPQAFGILVASVGAGAVVGALLLPRLRKRFSKDALVAVATALYAASLIALAGINVLLPLCIAMVVSGIAWITVLSSLQVAAQLALPDWVRSRGLAVFMATFMGSMALGSLLWGSLAQHVGIATTLLTAAGGALLAIGLSWRWKIGGIDAMDLRPSMHWPAPVTHEGVEPDRGPVMVTIAYQVDPAARQRFLHVTRELGKRRKRDGAFTWGIVEDTAHHNRFVEYFMVESWLDHLRQHDRVTHADRELQEEIRSLLSTGSAPQVDHFIAPDRKEFL